MSRFERRWPVDTMPVVSGQEGHLCHISLET